MESTEVRSDDRIRLGVLSVAMAVGSYRCQVTADRRDAGTEPARRGDQR
jgi:hypothetical protein